LLSNGYPELFSGVSTHAMTSNGHPFIVYSLLRDVFTGFLRNKRCPYIVGCALFGMCLPIRFLETSQSATICSSQDLTIGWMDRWIVGWIVGGMHSVPAVSNSLPEKNK
jgi:hypothetical protein